jgi:hypothetical protein
MALTKSSASGRANSTVAAAIAGGSRSISGKCVQKE